MYYLQPSSQLIPQTMWKINEARSNKLDKDRIFTSKWNPRRVSEVIYSSFWFLEQSKSCFEIDTRSPPSNHQRSCNRYTTPQRTWDALIPLVARSEKPNEESTNRDRCSGEVPTRQEQRNKRENKPIQYLTRFDNLPTSLRQWRKRFIDSTINYNLFLTFKEFPRGFFQRNTIHEGSNPYL